MNKREFIEKLSSITKYDIETCTKINEVLEENSLLGKKNKVNLVNDLMEKLSFSKEVAEDVYEKAVSIVTKELKEKIKHPFRSKD